jgi:cation:H+ antiporter
VTAIALLDPVALVAGLALLGWASDLLVDAAARLALAYRISPVVVGAIVVGFGTSAPEFAVSVLAAAAGSRDIAVGNVVGSNIANVTLVAATAALIAPLVVSSLTLQREAPISAAAVVLLAILLQGGLARAEGVVLLAVLIAAVATLIRHGTTPDDPIAAEAEPGIAARQARVGRRQPLRVAGGLLGVLVGAQLTVYGATGMARDLGLSEGVIGLTVVAIGTALPELVTAVQAARRGHADLVVGNVLGSNMFNSLGVAGIVALVAPGPLDDPALAGIGAAAMIATALIAWLFMGTHRCLQRSEGAALLLGYVVLLAVL